MADPHLGRVRADDLVALDRPPGVGADRSTPSMRAQLVGGPPGHARDLGERGAGRALPLTSTLRSWNSGTSDVSRSIEGRRLTTPITSINPSARPQPAPACRRTARRPVRTGCRPTPERRRAPLDRPGRGRSSEARVGVAVSATSSETSMTARRRRAPVAAGTHRSRRAGARWSTRPAARWSWRSRAVPRARTTPANPASGRVSEPRRRHRRASSTSTAIASTSPAMVIVLSDRVHGSEDDHSRRRARAAIAMAATSARRQLQKRNRSARTKQHGTDEERCRGGCRRTPHVGRRLEHRCVDRDVAEAGSHRRRSASSRRGSTSTAFASGSFSITRNSPGPRQRGRRRR